MIKRYLLAVVMLWLGLCTTQAQTVYESDSDIYGLGTQKTVKKFTHLIELGLSKGFEASYKVQRNFNPYLTWDILGFKYALEDDYLPNDYEEGWDADLGHKISIVTGIRAYTPKFGQWRGFAALDLGYQHDFYGACEHDYWWYDEVDDRKPHFISEFTIGLQYKKFHFGYGFTAPNDAYNFHLLRFGLTL